MFLIYKEIGQPAEAVKAALYAAESHLKNEDIQKAIENWKRVVEIDIQNVKAHVRLAMVYQRLGKNKLAISEFIHSASLLQFTGNPKKAAEAIEPHVVCCVHHCRRRHSRLRSCANIRRSTPSA